MLDKILITGASGFLGRAVCRKLKQEKYNIIPLNGKSDWDLTNQDHVRYLFHQHQPDKIIHLAARVGGIQANKDNPGLFLYENLSMGINLIETARKYGKLKKFIMIGTVCSYPKNTPVPFKEEDIWNGYPEETNAPYGLAKKTLMEMLVSYYHQYGMNSTNLIPVNMYGPWDNFNPKTSHVIPALILKIDKAITKGDSFVEIWGNGKASREFLYIDDCAEVISMSLDIDTTPYPINIGTGEECTISTLAYILKGIMCYHGDLIFNSNGMDGQPRRSLDISKAYLLFGFKANTELYQGLRNTVSWYYKNKEKFVDYFNNI